MEPLRTLRKGGCVFRGLEGFVGMPNWFLVQRGTKKPNRAEKHIKITGI